MRPGVEMLSEELGQGAVVQKGVFYQIKLRTWLSRGDAVRWSEPWGGSWGSIDGPRLEDDGATLITHLRIDRVSLFAGLFYGIQGMRVGGTRSLRIAPHLAYGESGVPGSIPSNALLTVEVTVISQSPSQ